MPNPRLTSELNEALPALRDAPQLLAFSTGADSLACLIRMLEWGMKPQLVYFEFLPRLYMVESYLRYVERFFGVVVHRLHSPLFFQFALNGLLQRPGVGMRVYKALRQRFSCPTTRQMNQWLLTAAPDAWIAIGLRVSDGIWRAKKLLDQGVTQPDRHEWYPVADCFRSDIVSIIAESGARLPVDYRLFGRSFESVRHSVADQLKVHCPRTWNQLRDYFPMINLLCAQQALLPVSRDICSRITSFGHLAFDNERCV